MIALLVANLFGVLGVKSASAQHCMYEIVAEISTPGCGSFEFAPIEATAMNDHGVVVGSFIGCNLDNNLPFIWPEETGFVEIPLPPGVPSVEPRDINNHGEITGRLVRPDVGGMRAFRYNDGVWTELPPTGGGVHSEGFAINDDGWVVGYRDTDEGRVAFRWRGDEVEELPTPIGGEAVAHDIDDQKTATGNFGTLSGYAFLWAARSVVEIPSLPNTVRSRGDAIVSPHSVTGGSVIEPPKGPSLGRSWFFDGNTVTDLGVLADLFHTQAIDMNAAEQIVGRCTNSAGGLAEAFLWQQDQIVNLESLIVNPPEFIALRHAYAINDAGRIVVHDPGRPLFVLAPVDRPLGDVNIDCVVDERDLIAVLDDWGPQGGKEGHPTDIVTSTTFQPPGDGYVDGADLAVVLGNWSTSTEASAPKRRR